MKRRVDFLNRLFDVLKCRLALLDFLKEEKLISDDKAQIIINEHHTTHAPAIASLLADLQKTEKLQLLQYEWTILPSELLRLTLVTQNSKKEFEYKL